MKKLIICLECLTIVAGIASAMLWFFAASDNRPSEILDSMGRNNNLIIRSDDFIKISSALSSEAKLNCLAAAFTGSVAFFQCISLWLKMKYTARYRAEETQ